MCWGLASELVAAGGSLLGLESVPVVITVAANWVGWDLEVGVLPVLAVIANGKPIPVEAVNIN